MGVYVYGPELEAMNALKLWQSNKQIPEGVTYNTTRSNGVLLSAPGDECVCVGLCFISLLTSSNYSEDNKCPYKQF